MQICNNASEYAMYSMLFSQLSCCCLFYAVCRLIVCMYQFENNFVFSEHKYVFVMEPKKSSKETVCFSEFNICSVC